MLDIEKLIKRQRFLESMNANWRNYHKDLADFCLPRKAWQTTVRVTGERLNLTHLYDSTAIRSLKVMSSGFRSYLTNPSSKWFGLQTRNVEYMKIRSVQMWFKEVEDIIFSVLNSSNFDTTMQEFYVDSGCFGTGIVLTLEDVSDKVRFTPVPPNQVNMEEDAQGRVNRLYRNFKYTVQQAYGLWNKNAGSVVTEKIKEKPQDMVDFIHYVGPRDSFDATKSDNINMPYVSVWLEVSKKERIEESGFMEFPYAVGRFYKDALDVMGFSPAMDVLADIKLINAMQRTMLRAGMKVTDPPMLAPSKGFILPLNLNPAAMNYRDEKVGLKALEQIPVSAGIPITREIIQDMQLNIEKGFFVPLFKAISDVTKQMTIPEVQRRIAENMVLLGPVIGRFTDEVLDPILVRVFNILYRNQELPLAPDIIQGQEMDIVYISPLAKMQRESEVFAIESFLTDVGMIAQAKPEALDKINEDAAVDIIGKIKGINPELIRDENEVAQIRQQRAQMQQAQAQLALAQQGADIIKTGTEAQKIAQPEKK